MIKEDLERMPLGRRKRGRRRGRKEEIQDTMRVRMLEKRHVWIQLNGSCELNCQNLYGNNTT